MKMDGKWVSNYNDLPLMGSSAGGGDSTAPDLLRFAQALRDNKLVDVELTNLITTGKVAVGPLQKLLASGFEESMKMARGSWAMAAGHPA